MEGQVEVLTLDLDDHVRGGGPESDDVVDMGSTMAMSPAPHSGIMMMFLAPPPGILGAAAMELRLVSSPSRNISSLAGGESPTQLIMASPYRASIAPTAANTWRCHNCNNSKLNH